MDSGRYSRVNEGGAGRCVELFGVEFRVNPEKERNVETQRSNY